MYSSVWRNRVGLAKAAYLDGHSTEQAGVSPALRARKEAGPVPQIPALVSSLMLTLADLSLKLVSPPKLESSCMGKVHLS